MQYAALPFRLKPQREVMLVSSRETKRWVIPKGWPMKGRKPHAAAAQEALEEAGVSARSRKRRSAPIITSRTCATARRSSAGSMCIR